jgi:signal transduction histidine kinase
VKEDFQKNSEKEEADLSKSVFRLKTLCDVSHVLLEQGNIDSILRNFLLMTLGSFGVVEGFAFMYEEKALIPEKLIKVGIDDKLSPIIERACNRLLVAYDYIPSMEHVNQRRRLSFFPPVIAYVSIFNIAYACNGIFGLGSKIVGEPYSDEDIELMETLIINLAATLKNIRSAQALKSAFNEVNSLNQAKTKVINHLSHELKTPISLLTSALSLLQKPLSAVPEDKWIRTYERANRSLKRLSSIQRGAEDIMRERVFPQHRVAAGLLNECSDIIECLTAEQTGDDSAIKSVRQKIDELYNPEGLVAEPIDLGNTVRYILKEVQVQASHRNIEFSLANESSQKIGIPRRILRTILMGLIKNAVENTPDEGRVEISVNDANKSVYLCIRDYGTGIAAKDRKHIFSGFYPTQATDKYSTKKPYEFNAGGKGTDLMRIKIFSERYGFKIDMTSTRCKHIPTNKDICPGKISRCDACLNPEDCRASGSTGFTIIFPGIKN